MFSPTPFPGWALRLLTGNSEVDCEHRLLLNAISRLNAVCSGHEHQAEVAASIGKEEFIDLLGDLLTFLIDHFYAEENLMKTCGLTVKEKELCEWHMEDHGAISDMVLRIVSSLDTPQISSLAEELHLVLKNWLERHIEIHDAVLVRLIKQH